MRAAPDGEGHWTQEITPNQRQGLRFKGQWNSRWIDVTCRDLAARTMPTLVDVGGLPTAEQEVIFDQCNYAIVLTRAEDSPARKSWRHFPDQTLLLLNGPMPMWLFVSLGRVYRHLQGVVGEQATLGFGKTS